MEIEKLKWKKMKKNSFKLKKKTNTVKRQQGDIWERSKHFFLKSKKMPKNARKAGLKNA